MIRLLTILFFSLWQCASPAQPFTLNSVTQGRSLPSTNVAGGSGSRTIDFLLDFETGSHDDTPTLTQYTNSTESLFTGAWVFLDSASSNFFRLSTNASWNSVTNLTVPGSFTNQADTGTRGLELYAGTNKYGGGTRAYVQRTFTTPLTNFVFCFYFRNNYNVTNFDNIDSILLQNASDYAVIQLRTYDPFAYRTHTSHVDSTGNGIPVNVHTYRDHLISGYYNGTGGTFMFGIFDANTRVQLSTNSWMNMNAVAAANLTIEAKKAATNYEVTNRLDNFMISTNTADFPSNPTNATITFLPWPL